MQAPGLSKRVGRLAARMVAANALYATHPKTRSLLPAWSRAVASLFGDAPDPLVSWPYGI